jgi:hypothetical protein
MLLKEMSYHFTQPYHVTQRIVLNILLCLIMLLKNCPYHFTLSYHGTRYSKNCPYHLLCLIMLLNEMSLSFYSVLSCYSTKSFYSVLSCYSKNCPIILLHLIMLLKEMSYHFTLSYHVTRRITRCEINVWYTIHLSFHNKQ